MDIFCETLVKRKLSEKDKQKVKTYFAALVSSSVLFIIVIPFVMMKNGIAYVSTISMLFFGLIVFLIYRALKNMQLEFEYIIVNDTLDIDKIVAQKKRTREISIELKTIEEIGIYDQNKFKGSSFNNTIRAEKNLSSNENFYIIVPHNNLGRTLVVFTPDKRMHEALKKTINPRLVRTMPEIED